MTQTLHNNWQSREPAPTSHLYELSLQNFRCFAHKKLEILQPQLLVIGSNGAGKSSLLEAIYFASYAHSFRTRISKQMIREGTEALNINLKIRAAHQTCNEVTVGLGLHKKLLKINGQTIASHAEVGKLFNCATLTQEDMNLVSLGPDQRRSFLNQCQFLTSHNWLELARRYKQVLEQRNALLFTKSKEHESLKIWTAQHWEITRQIQTWRQEFLTKLQVKCNGLLDFYLPKMGSHVVLKHKPTVDCLKSEFKDFFTMAQAEIIPKEQIMGRSMFGAHLDDFYIEIFGRCARNFASRGEQKLLTFLIKCAALQIVQEAGVKIGCLLIDDFLTDLDKDRIEKCKHMIAALNIQTIITMPILRRDLFEKNFWTQEVSFD
jgi:DNA replication and repair protein RecF